MPIQGEPRFLKVTDVAEVLNVTAHQVRVLLTSGDLRGIHVSKRGEWRIEAVELEDYIQRQYAETRRRLDEDASEPSHHDGQQLDRGEGHDSR